MTWSCGPRNLITDVPGLTVGHADDATLKSGVTVVLPDQRAIAGVHITGGAPGTRETELLSPQMTVDSVDAIALSGGSAFGLDAASGVQAWLREHDRGFPVRSVKVPIVPAAILIDLLNGGDKDWGRYPPYRELGYRAVAESGMEFRLGTAGAGVGATTSDVKGGLGSASAVLESGLVVGALAAVNAVGSATIGTGRHFWAAPFEIGSEFGGLGLPSPMPADAVDTVTKVHAAAGANTTLAIVATDAPLTAAQATRLATAAHDGIARAIWPAHTSFDGDTVFTLATGTAPIDGSAIDLIELEAAAAATLTRAIARGVYEAEPAVGDSLPAWRDLGE